MININMCEINETYNMIEHEKLDVRTVTLGISPLEYVDSNLEALNEKIYKKITTLAKNLTSTGQDVETDFGIPIVNKHISVIPIVPVGGSACRRPEDFVTITKALDTAVKEVGVSFTGGYSVLVSKGMTRADKSLTPSIPQALSQTKRVCSSVSVGSTKTGIDMDAVEFTGRTVTETTEATRNHDSLGCAKPVVLCSAPNDSLFMADAFHGVTESEAIINVDANSLGTVRVALAKVGDVSFEVFYETIKKTALKIIRVGQLVAQKVSRRMGIPLGIIDLLPAPTPPVGDSVAEILEEIGLECVGAPGTAAALAVPNDRVKKGDVMASSYVDGLSGAFVPVNEDQRMTDVVSMGAPTIEELGAMTYVCSVGLDTIAISGDTPSSTITGVIADETAIGMVNQKTTAVRLIPVVGKKVGETAEFDGLLGYAPIMPVNTFSCRRSVTRGGRIPAPIRSFEN